jgi:methylmalonyl-CoA mutase
MQKLFTEFNSTTAAQWKEQLVKDLKGIDYNTLVWKTNSGIDVQPFYTKENLSATPLPVFSKNDWAICENIFVSDEKTANTQALNALQNGASGLVFHITKQTDFTVLLKDILLQHLYSLFLVKPEFEKELSSFLSSIDRGSACFVECDTVLDGQVNSNTSSAICIHANLYQEAGCSTVNELALCIAHLNEYLNVTSTKISTIHLNISVGGDFFMEIAKIRALRKLVGFLSEQYNIKAEVHIHAQTTLINKSTIDSYTNMLRSTTETMSASIGGANSIVVLPFDVEFNAQNDFSSRMARNQQLILKDESYLSIVSDMAAGSYYIEHLTEALCQKAWEQFKIIESKGGLIAGLKSNYIQDIISQDAEILIEQYKSGKLILVGVNKFQNKNEAVKVATKKNASHPSGIKAINLSESLEQRVAN